METQVITVFAAEERGGRITIATNRDCLPPDAIRTSTRVFPDYDSVLETAEMYFRRGYSVSVEVTGHALAEYEQ